MAVVDSKARVIGVHNLRVVDASSMALLTPVSSSQFTIYGKRRRGANEKQGHPMSTIYVMAEKLSADILAAAKN